MKVFFSIVLLVLLPMGVAFKNAFAASTPFIKGEGAVAIPESAAFAHDGFYGDLNGPPILGTPARRDDFENRIRFELSGYIENGVNSKNNFASVPFHLENSQISHNEDTSIHNEYSDTHYTNSDLHNLESETHHVSSDLHFPSTDTHSPQSNLHTDNSITHYVSTDTHSEISDIHSPPSNTKLSFPHLVDT
jgi:hypothetical protein